MKYLKSPLLFRQGTLWNGVSKNLKSSLSGGIYCLPHMAEQQQKLCVWWPCHVFVEETASWRAWLTPSDFWKRRVTFKEPSCYAFLPSYFFLLLYISISNVVAKSHRDLSCAKVLWVDKAASSFAVFTWITMWLCWTRQPKMASFTGPADGPTAVWMPSWWFS